MAPPPAQPVRQLLYLIAALVLVLVLMTRASDPANWRWLTNLNDADAVRPAVQPVDARVLEGDMPGGFTSQAASPGEAVDALPRDGSSPAAGSSDTAIDLDVFEGIRDKTRTVPQRAYFHLLDVARRVPAEEFERAARRDITFAQLASTPHLYRGTAVHLKGHVRRMTRLQPVANQAGFDTLYEGWLFTDESLDNPYVIITSRVPQGFPLGGEVLEDVSFVGFFLKLWSYRAGDGARYAPLLLGQRVVWHPAPQSIAPGRREHGLVIGVAVGLVVLLAAASWTAHRRAQAIRRATARAPAESDEAGRSMTDLAGPTAQEYLQQLEAEGEKPSS